MRTYFTAVIWACLAGLPVLAPHANCHTIIAKCANAIFATISKNIDTVYDEMFQAQCSHLLKKAYDQARIDIEARYPAFWRKF